jgi:cytochrome c oxidase assembly protein subunit 15
VLGLLALQFALGIADVLLLAPAWMQLLHLLGADLYWVALVILAADAIWPAPKPTVPGMATPSPVTTTAA